MKGRDFLSFGSCFEKVVPHTVSTPGYWYQDTIPTTAAAVVKRVFNNAVVEQKKPVCARGNVYKPFLYSIWKLESTSK